MKLRIKDTGEKVCEVWIEQEGERIHLRWRDEHGNMLYIATLRNDKTITLSGGSGFTQK